jgi:hypothetical protein
MSNQPGLTGPIPTEIAQLKQLTSISAANTSGITGLLPAISELTGLTYIDLSYNQLGGSIPSTIGKFTNLT